MTRQRKTVSAQELLVTNTMEIDALVELLVQKEIITLAELLEEIRIMNVRKIVTASE